MKHRRKIEKKILAVLLICLLATETLSGSIAWAGQQDSQEYSDEGQSSQKIETLGIEAGDDSADSDEKGAETPGVPDETGTETPGVPDEMETETPGVSEEPEGDTGAVEEERTEGIAVDETNFPDESLRGLVKILADTDEDGYLSVEETSAVTKLDMAHCDIFSLHGLEFFTNLKELDISWNHLKKEDVESLINEEHFSDLEKAEIRNNSYLADTEEELIEETERELSELKTETDNQLEGQMGPEEYFTWVSVISAEDFQEVQIDEVAFPDEAFRDFVKGQYDKNEDQKLSPEELRPVTSLYLKDSGIQDLTGLAYFKNLVFLECSENQLEVLDVSALKELRGLYCRTNQITALDLTENIHLRQLACDENVVISGWNPPVPGNKEDGTEDTEKENLGAAATYTVTFNSSGGSAVKAQTVQSGGVAKAPASPTKSKYIFGGWYLGDEKYDFSTVVKKNMTLTAKWSKVTVARASISKTSNSKKGVLSVSYKKLSKVSGYDVQIAGASN